MELLPKGLLELEKMAQTALQPDSPSRSETSSESQEFQHNNAYTVVIWRVKSICFCPVKLSACACFIKRTLRALAGYLVRTF